MAHLVQAGIPHGVSRGQAESMSDSIDLSLLSKIKNLKLCNQIINYL